MSYCNFRNKQTNQSKCSSITKKGRRCLNVADFADKCNIHAIPLEEDGNFIPCEICKNLKIPPKNLKCGHHFHSRCILSKYDDDCCPICKRKIFLSKGDYFDFKNNKIWNIDSSVIYSENIDLSSINKMANFQDKRMFKI